MIKKLLILPAFFAVLLQVSYKSEFTTMLSKGKLGASEYDIFTNEFRSFALLFTLLIVLGILFFSKSQIPKQQTTASKYWYAGFLAILLFSTATVVYVNPQGRFPWNKRDAYIAIEARSQKLDLYKNLNHTPDLLLLGSSASFQIPMSYFKEKWGIDAFNMSVNGGEPVDFVNLINIIKKMNPDSNMPAVVAVEILSPELKVGERNDLPIEFIPFMNSMDQKRKALRKLIRTSFQVNLFSDSIFTLLIVDQGHWNVPIIINNDNGTITRLGTERVTDEQYRKKVESAVDLFDSLQDCKKLDVDGKIALEELVQLSHEYKFSLVFYRPPINDDFFNFSKFRPSRYIKCSRLFNEYFKKNILRKNPNVFYTDLSYYEKISAGGKEMYLDTHHPTRLGSLLVLQAMNHEIEAALQWAKKNR